MCVCGKPRTRRNLEFVLAHGALRELPQLLGKAAGAGAPIEPVALFDATTHKLFGERVLRSLSSGGIEAKPLVLGDDARPFEPDEVAVRMAEEAVMGLAHTAVIGVGSGAVNDLGKYIAAKRGLRYVSVATAPSMDGFAAPISAIVVNKVKTTVASTSPDAVVADLDILTGAPRPLVSAGFGDVLGKLTSLTDWRLARVLFDEYWCQETAEEVGAIARRVMLTASSVSERSPEAVGDLMEALVRAGASVLHVGSSRPTSGAEHLVSHFIEMWSANRGMRPPAHGHVVGVGTLIASRVAEALQQVDTLPAAALVEVRPEEVLKELKIDGVPENFGLSKFDETARKARRTRIADRWSLARQELSRLPRPSEIADVLHKAGCPTRLSDLGIQRDVAVRAIGWCRFLRERYTLFDLAADVGILPELVEELAAEYA